MRILNTIAIGKEVILMNLIPSRRAPLSVHVGLTNRCNSRCRYCRFDRLSAPDYWTTQNLLDLLGELRSAGTRRVQFTGGEPMLRKDIGVILDRAKSLGMYTGISTNGFQVPDRVGELCSADIVQISYDGPESVHDYLRGEGVIKPPGRPWTPWEKTGSRPGPILSLLRSTPPGLKRLSTTPAGGRSRLISFSLIIFRNPASTSTPPAGRSPTWSSPAKRKPGRSGSWWPEAGWWTGGRLASGIFENALNWPWEDRVTSPEPSPLYRCWAGRATAHLEADGKLYACGMGVGRVAGIEVGKIGFSAAWRQLKPLPECRSCTMACGVEANLLFSLNLRAAWNWFRQT